MREKNIFSPAIVRGRKQKLSGTDGKKDAESGPGAGLGFHFDQGSVIVQYLPGDAQAQAGAVGLASEERIKNPLPIFFPDSRAVVRHFEDEIGRVLLEQGGDLDSRSQRCISQNQPT